MKLGGIRTRILVIALLPALIMAIVLGVWFAAIPGRTSILLWLNVPAPFPAGLG